MITVTIKCCHDLHAMRANSEENTWNQGAAGEELVANTLEQLGNGYVVLNDVMLPGEKGNVDHIVIGENGIFVIETKNHKGSISCIRDAWMQHRTFRNGVTYENEMGSPSKQVKGKALALKRFLRRHYPRLSDVWITAIIVFANKETAVKTFKPAVDVLKPDELISYLRSCKAQVRISPQDVKQLARLLEAL